MRKVIIALLIIGSAVGFSGCANTATANGTYDSSKAVMTEATNVDYRTPEQRYLDKLREVGLSIADDNKAVVLGRMICQMYSNGSDEATVQNAVALIVRNSRTAAGRGSEVITIAKTYFCPEAK